MRLSGWQIPKSQLSASSLTLAIQCPEQFRQKHILKVKEKVFGNAIIGRVDHSVWEAAYSWKRELHAAMTQDTLQKLYADQWEHHLAEEDGQVDWQGEDPVMLQERGLKMLDAYYPVYKTIVPIKIEEKFEEKISGVPVPIIGYIDLETEPSIIERKTAGVKVSKPKSKWRFQGRIYSMVAAKPVDYHIVTKQVTPKVYTPAEESRLHVEQPNHDATVNMIRQTVEKLNDLYARYGPDTPWPTDGIFHDWLCDYCSFGVMRGTGSCIAWRKHG